MSLKRISPILMLSIVFSFLHSPMSVSANVGFRIRPPFNGDFKLTSYFDHTLPNGVRTGPITVYTGDTSNDGTPYYYPGHAGIDWGMAEGTPVYAVADGNVRFVGRDDSTFGKYIQIDHQNGYFSLYGHLSITSVVAPNSVRVGDLIGYSGNTGSSSGAHLHLQIYYGPDMSVVYSTDPFGWNGSLPDPLIDYGGVGQGHQANCMWRSLPQDPVSCNDIVDEDGSWDFFPSDASWYVNGDLGYGDHSLTHLSASNLINSVNVQWTPRHLRSGIYWIYAYIPPMSDQYGHLTTSSAKYTIHKDRDVTETISVNQSINADHWVLLGRFYLWQFSYVELNTYTNESSTTLVGADAIKFRTFTIFIPTTIKQN